MGKRFYGKGPSKIDPAELKGTLIVLEGGDGSGRSTQSKMLRDWLERLGYPTTEVGLKRSLLVGGDIESAKQGNMLCPITFSLFYATDFADQLEHALIPALRAGFIVIADRYIYTPMARDIVRGADPEWISAVYGMALVPDLIFYLKTSPRVLAERNFQKTGVLDYWESGMDIQRSDDIYKCFIKYQGQVAREFERMSKGYGFTTIDGNREPNFVHADIQKVVERMLKPRQLALQRPEVKAKRASSRKGRGFKGKEPQAVIKSTLNESLSEKAQATRSSVARQGEEALALPRVKG
jgi:dTMP kinase